MEREFVNVFVRTALPEFDWILSEMEKANGWLILPEPLITTISKLKLEWWKAYDDSKLYYIYHALMYVDLDTLKSIQTPEEAAKLTETITKESFDLITSEELKDTRSYTEKEKEELLGVLTEFLDNCSEDEKKEFWQQAAFYWVGFLLALHEILALMIHGRSMRQLVKDAKAGDDTAYILAVQTDRSILNHPYFSQRLLNAHLSGDYQFLDALGYRIKNPLISGRIKNRTLYLLFALLESEDMLEMPLKDLLALCQEVGVYGDNYGMGDTNSLGKRRKEFRRLQGTRKLI